MKYIIEDLLALNIMERGDFTLKSGEKSNIYVDLRKLVSHPQLLRTICSEINILIKDDKFDALLGVPTGGYSFSQTCSILSNKPCLFLRKETKDHGKKQQIEGVWKKGDEIILIEDVINSGASILETIDKLEKLGLIIIKNYCSIKTEK
jgi:orotate phosphoribosyltransferase